MMFTKKLASLVSQVCLMVLTFVFVSSCATMGGAADQTPQEKIDQACVKQFGQGSQSSKCVKVVKDASVVQPCIQAFGDGKDGMWCLENATRGPKVTRCIEAQGNGEKGKACITKE